MGADKFAELELGSSDSDVERRSDGSTDTEGEPWHHISAVKRVLIFGGTLAFALVFVVGVAGTASSGALPPPNKLMNLPAETQLAVTNPGTKDGAPAVRGALATEPVTAYSSNPSTAPGVVPQANLPGQGVQTQWTPLAENKRRRPTGSLKPAEHMQDGNVCDDTEELYAGLCYTKCSILTGMPQAKRTTAFSCCPTGDCHGNILKMKTASLVPCHGYDVSSSDGGVACPHIRGECLEDEEQFLGECFEKCSVLTNGKYTQRIAAASCCNPDGIGGCFNFGNDYTNANLDVGGGAGDGDASTPSGAHYPLKYLTETN